MIIWGLWKPLKGSKPGLCCAVLSRPPHGHLDWCCVCLILKLKLPRISSCSALSMNGAAQGEIWGRCCPSSAFRLCCSWVWGVKDYCSKTQDQNQNVQKHEEPIGNRGVEETVVTQLVWLREDGFPEPGTGGSSSSRVRKRWFSALDEVSFSHLLSESYSAVEKTVSQCRVICNKHIPYGSPIQHILLTSLFNCKISAPTYVIKFCISQSLSCYFIDSAVLL